MKHFAWLFFPMAAVLALILTGFHYHGWSVEHATLQSAQSYSVRQAETAVARDFEAIGADLRTLAEAPALRLVDGDPESLRALIDLLVTFTRYQRLYDQVAFYAVDGTLRAAVSFETDDYSVITEGGEVEASPDAEFIATARELPASGIAVSPLELTESAQDSVRATVRFATPVDVDGERRGILIVSYLGSRLIELMREAMRLSRGSEILINRNGDWMQYASTPGSWQLRSHQRFPEMYPTVWEQLLAEKEGQIFTEAGMFTFTTVYPLQEAMERIPGGTVSSDASPTPRFWKVAALVSSEELAAVHHERLRRGLTLYAIALLPALGLSLYGGRLVRQREQSLAHTRELSTVVEQTSDLVMITDAQGRVRYVNPCFEFVTGFSQAAIVGRTPALLNSGEHDAAFYQRLWAAITAGHNFQAVFINRKRDGSRYYEQKTITPLKSGNDRIHGYVSTGKDITEQMEAQAKLQQLAFHHPLTGLANRALFRDHLNEALARARRHEHGVAVLFLDLDGFKQINDSMGHQAGDALLKQVANRLKQTVRAMDTVAHIGGDEFTVMVDEVEQPGQIYTVAKKVLQVLKQPYEIDGKEIHVGASIGVAVFPRDADTADLLVEHADAAMYHAKRQGKNRYEFYSREMTHQAAQRLDLENRLRRAIHTGEFELRSQPIVAATGSVQGMEALLRWRQPSGRLAAPSEFIQVLEETSMIVPLTGWILREACHQCRRLQDAGMSDLRVAVNVSPRSLQQGNLAQLVEEAITDSGLERDKLILEVTESTLLDDEQVVRDTLSRLQQLQVRIAIDDFGSGYSSFGYLRRLPADIIKIDRSFIQGIAPGSRDATLVSAMLAMAQHLGLRVIAEGVETIEQRDFLVEQDCHGLQGYLFSNPVSAAALAKEHAQER